PHDAPARRAAAGAHEIDDGDEHRHAKHRDQKELRLLRPTPRRGRPQRARQNEDQRRDDDARPVLIRERLAKAALLIFGELHHQPPPNWRSAQAWLSWNMRSRASLARSQTSSLPGSGSATRSSISSDHQKE